MSIEVEFRLNFRTVHPDSREAITRQCGEEAQKEFWQGQIRTRKKRKKRYTVYHKTIRWNENTRRWLISLCCCIASVCFNTPYSMWSRLLRQRGTQEPVYHHQFYDESLPVRFLPLHGICCQVLHLWFHIFLGCIMKLWMSFQQAAIEWERLHCQQLVTSDYLESVTVIITIAIILCRIRVGFLKWGSRGNYPGAWDCQGPQQLKIRTLHTVWAYN